MTIESSACSHNSCNADLRLISDLSKQKLITTDFFPRNSLETNLSYVPPLKIGEFNDTKLACCEVSLSIDPLFPK